MEALGNAGNAYNALAVLAVMFEIQDEDNPLIQPIVNGTQARVLSSERFVHAEILIKSNR